MAKISPVSIKYMIHANFSAEGALEKPDVIGAIFGQTEGLLGAELEMRELQKDGKIKIPTALDQSETTLIAAAMETIERIGPSDSQIEVERIEDVRGSKRDYILDRAKKLMSEIKGSTDSREISNEIKDSARTANIQEYGNEKLPCGNISGKEIIVVEGRADVVNLLRAGINNVIAMNGTKLPDAIKELGKEKGITLFVDGDRGGKLIIQNVFDILMYIKQNVDGKGVDSLHAYDKLVIADIEAYYDNKVANIPIMLQVKNILKLRKDYKIILRSIRTNRKSEICLPNNYFDRNIHGSEILKVGEIYEFEIHEPIPGMDNELVHVYSLTNDIKNFNLFYERPITIKDIRR